MINQTCNASVKRQQTVKTQEQKTESREREKETVAANRKERITKIERRKKGSKRPLKRRKKRKCEKGGITIMDQPINLPSQFISLRWRCVEIHRSKISLFGS
jgi:hypothetical protein